MALAEALVLCKKLTYTCQVFFFFPGNNKSFQTLPYHKRKVLLFQMLMLQTPDQDPVVVFSPWVFR